MVVTSQNVADVIASLNRQTVIALDCESTGLEETDRAFAVIIATSTAEYYFDFRALQFVPILTPILSNEDLIVVFQNAKFDLRMLQSIGLPIDFKCVDITSMARLIRNDYLDGGYSLAAQAKRELGKNKTDKELKEYIKKYDLVETRSDYFGEQYKCPRYDKVPMDVMQDYACNDARLTYDLYQHYLPRLDERSFKVFRSECDLIKVCYQMERVGLKLNIKHIKKAYAHEVSLLNKAKSDYFKRTLCEFVNSAKSIQKHLEYELPLTEEGNPSLTDEVLSQIILEGTHRDKETAAIVRSIRLYSKRITTYYESYLNLMDRKGIIHPTMWIAGTRTGRFSYSNPNCQNIPKEEGTDYSIRECFTPREGKVYVSIDYQAQEYRVLLDYAGEHEVIKEVMAGKDLHQATADAMGVSRKEAKTLGFMILYGGGDRALADALNVPLQKARMLKTKFFSALPKVGQFVDGVISTGRGRGYVINWVGRRLFADREFCYALPNHLIQGGCADVIKLAMVRIAKELPEVTMLLQVHDQLVFELEENELYKIKRIKEIMESVYHAKNGMKLTVDVSISERSLAEKDMKKYEPTN